MAGAWRTSGSTARLCRDGLRSDGNPLLTRHRLLSTLSRHSLSPTTPVARDPTRPFVAANIPSRNLRRPRRRPWPPRQAARLAASFDDLVGKGEDRSRDRQPQRLRRLEIDNQLVLGRLLDRQVGGLGAFEDLVDVSGGAPPQLVKARPVTSGPRNRHTSSRHMSRHPFLRAS
jgi:hypothetical protein